MLQNLLEQLTTLLQGQKELKEIDDIIQSKIDAIKTALVEVMPTDVYSTEEFTLSKKKDFDMEIKAEDLPEYYKKSQPDRAKIREALLFGMEVSGVVSSPKITLTIRKK